ILNGFEAVIRIDKRLPVTERLPFRQEGIESVSLPALVQFAGGQKTNGKRRPLQLSAKQRRLCFRFNTAREGKEGAPNIGVLRFTNGGRDRPESRFRVTPGQAFGVSHT